ncbi:hypothetical protein GCM10010388_71060 [Streptomyces mauvecolor]
MVTFPYPFSAHSSSAADSVALRDFSLRRLGLGSETDGVIMPSLYEHAPNRIDSRAYDSNNDAGNGTCRVEPPRGSARTTGPFRTLHVLFWTLRILFRTFNGLFWAVAP